MNIDRIARQMTDVEPSPGLEARIRARLDEAQPRAHTSSWWLWRVAAPAGALASIALAIGVAVQGPGAASVQAPKVKTPPEVTATGSQNRSGLGSASATSPLRTISPLRHYSDRQSQPGHALTPAELAWMERRIPALDPVTPLQIDGLSVDSIQPEPVAITPLIITALPTDGGSSERHDNR